MTIILSPELERMIQEKVKAGVYPSAEAVVRDAIARLLESDEGFEPGELDALVKVGTDELDRAEELDGGKVFEDMRRRSAEFRAGRKV